MVVSQTFRLTITGERKLRLDERLSHMYVCVSDRTGMYCRMIANDCYELLESTESLCHVILRRNHVTKRRTLSLDKVFLMEAGKHCCFFQIFLGATFSQKGYQSIS